MVMGACMNNIHLYRHFHVHGQNNTFLNGLKPRGGSSSGTIFMCYESLLKKYETRGNFYVYGGWIRDSPRTFPVASILATYIFFRFARKHVHNRHVLLWLLLITLFCYGLITSRFPFRVFSCLGFDGIGIEETN